MARARLLFLFLSTLRAIHPLSLGLDRETPSRAGKRALESSALEIKGDQEAFGFFLRRDSGKENYAQTNALGLVHAVVKNGEQLFAFGAGVHFQHETRLNERMQNGVFSPAFAFSWTHPTFQFIFAGAERMARTSLSLLSEILLPIEWNTEYEFIDKQTPRWSFNTFVFLVSWGGLTAGFEPLTMRTRAGAWVTLADSLRLRTVVSFETTQNLLTEFSLSYTFSTEGSRPVQKRVQKERMEKDSDDERSESGRASSKYKKKRRALPKSVPRFGLLVKWGLAPVEALKFAKTHDVCALNAASQAALARKNWRCYAKK